MVLNTILGGMPRITKKLKSGRKHTTKHPHKKQQLGGHVPNEINPIIYDKEKRHEMINNLGRPMTKSSLLGSGKLPEITEEQMNKDIVQLKKYLEELENDEKYKLCAELVLSLYDSLDVVSLPVLGTTAKLSNYNGWGSDALKSSHTFQHFVKTVCFKTINRHNELLHEKQELKRMSAKDMKKATPAIDSLILPNITTEIAKLTPKMQDAEKKVEEIKPALGALLTGVSDNKLSKILTDLGYSKPDIAMIFERIKKCQKILPQEFSYNYILISNGTEIFVVAISAVNNFKYLLTNHRSQIELISDPTGEFFQYTYEPYSAPPKVVPYRVSIHEIIKTSLGTNTNQLSASNITTMGETMKNTRASSAGPKLPKRSKAMRAKLQEANKRTRAESTGPRNKLLKWKHGISECNEYKTKEECDKQPHCEYIIRSKTHQKCRTKRTDLSGVETKYSSNSSSSSSDSFHSL